MCSRKVKFGNFEMLLENKFPYDEIVFTYATINKNQEVLD